MLHELPLLKHTVYAYLEELFSKETPEQFELREQAAHLELANMQISLLQAQLLRFLIQLTGAKRCLELGTYCGYSALVMAQTLPKDGIVHTCDINQKTVKYAYEAWRKANVSEQVIFHLGPALETLNMFVKGNEIFDLIFIDADKTNYINYYQLAKQLLAPKGIILIDNILWDGKVIDDKVSDRQTKAIRQFNQVVKDDPEVSSCVIPLGDGLTLIQLN